MHKSAVAQLKTEAQLRRAVEAGCFLMHYQPVVELTQGTVVGCEALVRWDHPDHGVVGAGRFLDIAEESGLIVPIGWTAIESGCRQLKDRVPST